MNDDLFFHNMIASADWSLFPFNGQLTRSRKVQIVLNSLMPSLIIETGTYRGVTTEYLYSISNIPVVSIEIDKDFFDAAMQRFAASGTLKGIELIHGHSVTCLKELFKRDNFKEKGLFVYLDAHWGEDLPLFEELILFSGWDPPIVILIDDFKVEKFPMYGFDSYNDVAICSENLPHLARFKLFVPSESHLVETGARRGSGYLLNKSAITLLPLQFFEGLEEIHF
jgi:hypothetical protein